MNERAGRATGLPGPGRRRTGTGGAADDGPEDDVHHLLGAVLLLLLLGVGGGVHQRRRRQIESVVEEERTHPKLQKKNKKTKEERPKKPPLPPPSKCLASGSAFVSLFFIFLFKKKWVSCWSCWIEIRFSSPVPENQPKELAKTLLKQKKKKNHSDGAGFLGCRFRPSLAHPDEYIYVRRNGTLVLSEIEYSTVPLAAHQRKKKTQSADREPSRSLVAGLLQDGGWS